MTTSPTFTVSVLDQSPAIAGRGHEQSVQDTLELARHCEALGYHRYWLAEHHNHDTIVGTAPEILMAAIAATTSRIRIGSAGIMLPHYSALKVAEQFRMLEAIAPGRIDLGVGRAPGSDGRTAQALNPAFAQGPDRFPAQVRDLIAWVHGEALPEGHPFRTVRAFPDVATAPQVWMLGSSDYGAQVAAYFGLPYSFAYFITDGRGASQALDIYRQHYEPSARHSKPRTSVCVWALAADTEEEAQRLFTTRAVWRVQRDRGPVKPLVSPAEAAEQLKNLTEAERARVELLRRDSLVGTPDAVGAKLRELAGALQIDELVLLTWTADAASRRRSYELMAKELGLDQSSTARLTLRQP